MPVGTTLKASSKTTEAEAIITAEAKTLSPGAIIMGGITATAVEATKIIRGTPEITATTVTIIGTATRIGTEITLTTNH
jgi:hypothetical protein